MFAGGWDLFEASWAAREFMVEVAVDSRTYRVERDKLLGWLSKDRDSSAQKSTFAGCWMDLRNNTLLGGYARAWCSLSLPVT